MGGASWDLQTLLGQLYAYIAHTCNDHTSTHSTIRVYHIRTIPLLYITNIELVGRCMPAHLLPVNCSDESNGERIGVEHTKFSHPLRQKSLCKTFNAVRHSKRFPKLTLDTVTTAFIDYACHAKICK